ncbi:MAG: hypothetical protein V3V08_00840 [Nannocystaceae bacterium]
MTATTNATQDPGAKAARTPERRTLIDAYKLGILEHGWALAGDYARTIWLWQQSRDRVLARMDRLDRPSVVGYICLSSTARQLRGMKPAG